MAYKIALTDIAYRKFRGYIELVENEVSGLAEIEKDEYTDSIIIKDLILLPQVVSPALTTMDKDGLDQWMRDCMDKDIDISKYRCWWHSHANFGVFWSGTDDATINDFDTEQEKDNFFVSIVGNHKGDILGRIDVYHPFRYTMDKVLVEVLEPEDGLLDELRKEVAEKVKVETPKIYIPADTNKSKKKDNSMKPAFKSDKYELEPIPIPDDDNDTPKIINPFDTSYMKDPAVVAKIDRLPEDDQIRGYYWQDYLFGNWPDVRSLEEVLEYGPQKLFQRTTQNGIEKWIPKPPDCKWYRKLIMSEVNKYAN